MGEIDNLRSDMSQPQSFCRAELTEQYSINDVQPSVPQGQITTAKIEHTDYMSRQNVKLLKEVDKLKRCVGIQLRARGLTEATYSFEELALAIPVELKEDSLGNTRFKAES